jgi:NADH-quinone oxidoreductase subunit E
VGLTESKLLTPDTRRRIAETASRYDDARSAVLPALYLAQEQIGYVPDEAVTEVAEELGLPESEVGAVASFYTMLYKKPVGEHVISVCETLSCALMGAEHALDFLSRKLEIKVGETTPDGKFSLHAVQCLGACDMAPAAMIDGQYHGNLTEEKLDTLLRQMGWEGS